VLAWLRGFAQQASSQASPACYRVALPLALYLEVTLCLCVSALSCPQVSCTTDVLCEGLDARQHLSTTSNRILLRGWGVSGGKNSSVHISLLVQGVQRIDHCHGQERGAAYVALATTLLGSDQKAEARCGWHGPPVPQSNAVAAHRLAPSRSEARCSGLYCLPAWQHKAAVPSIVH
jgi:hypothetical protein